MPSGSPATFRSTAQRKRILEALASYGPMGWTEVADKLGERVEPVRSVLDRMSKAAGSVRPVHIHGWVRSNGKLSPWTPVFKIGDGPDRSRPGRPFTQGRKTRRDEVVKALQELGPSTAQEVARYTKMTYSSAWGHLTSMHELQQVHVRSWRRSTGTRGAMARRWMLGKGEDAPMPSKITARQRDRAYQERKRKARGAKGKGFNPWAGLAC